jgi:hypothetical protein
MFAIRTTVVVLGAALAAGAGGGVSAEAQGRRMAGEIAVPGGAIEWRFVPSFKREVTGRGWSGERTTRRRYERREPWYTPQAYSSAWASRPARSSTPRYGFDASSGLWVPLRAPVE